MITHCHGYHPRLKLAQFLTDSDVGGVLAGGGPVLPGAGGVGDDRATTWYRRKQRNVDGSDLWERYR